MLTVDVFIRTHGKREAKESDTSKVTIDGLFTATFSLSLILAYKASSANPDLLQHLTIVSMSLSLEVGFSFLIQSP